MDANSAINTTVRAFDVTSLLRHGVSFLVALLLLGGGIASAALTYRDLSHDVRTTGTVVAQRTSHGRHGTTYAPTIRFATPDGAYHEFTPSVHTSSPAQIGAPARVAYDPADPSRAYADDFAHTYELAAWLIPFGLFALVITALSLRRERRVMRFVRAAASKTAEQAPVSWSSPPQKPL